MTMKAAMAIVTKAGLEVEQIKGMKGKDWHALLAEAKDDNTKHCLQSLRWTGGDLKKLYDDRNRQKMKRAEMRKAYLNSRG